MRKEYEKKNININIMRNEMREKIKLEKKLLNNSYDDILKQFCKNKLSKGDAIYENLEKKETKNKSNKKSKRQFKIITGLNITKDIEIIEDSIENNIPYRIKYQNYTFNIGGSRHENKQRITLVLSIL